MPIPPVVVEIAPPESPPELRRALVEACTRAARDVGCVEAGSGPEEVEPVVVAIVSWRDATNVRLEVALRPQQQWVVRQIGFDARDAPDERWRAVGLVIGTLASVIVRQLPASADLAPAPESEAPREPPPKESVPPPAAPGPPPPAHVPPRVAKALPPPARRPRRVRVETSVVTGTGLSSEAVRAGAELRGRASLGLGGFEASSAVQYAESVRATQSVHATWAGAFVGLAWTRALGERFEGVFRLEGMVERFGASVDDARAPSRKYGSRWLGGARLGAELVWWTLDPVGVFLGAAGTARSGSTEVSIDGAHVGSSPALAASAELGVAIAIR